MKQEQHFRYLRNKNPLKEFVDKRALQSCKHKTPKTSHQLLETCMDSGVHLVIGRQMEIHINHN